MNPDGRGGGTRHGAVAYIWVYPVFNYGEGGAGERKIYEERRSGKQATWTSLSSVCWIQRIGIKTYRRYIKNV